MIMADVLFYFLLVVGFYVIFIGYWLATEALFPRLVESCRERYERSTVSSVFVGLGVGIPPAAIGLVMAGLQGHPLVQMLGLGIVFTLIFISLMGSSGLCAQIGRGLPSPVDAAQPWRRVLRGGIILGLTFLLPVAGWFIVLPLTLISGLGVAARSFIAAQRARWQRMNRREIPLPQHPAPPYHPHDHPAASAMTGVGVGIPQVRP